MPKLDLQPAKKTFESVSEWIAFAEQAFPGREINRYEIIEIHKQSKRAFAIAQTIIMVAQLDHKEWQQVVGVKVRR